MKLGLPSIKSLVSSFFAAFLLVVISACTGASVESVPTARIALRSDPKTLDPVLVEDFYSAHAVGPVYEGLLEYEYLKRPHELKPLLAASMPEISKDGLTYTFKIKPGVKFQDDAAFEGGKGRDVKASDFVYSLLRVADPKIQSSMFWVFDGHIVGLNEWREAQKNQVVSNYDAPIEGIKAIDDLTLQIKLKQKYPQLMFVLAMPCGSVVAKEVVAKYGKDFVNKPVGTGPFRFVEWMRGSKLVYEKNPTYRQDFYPTQGEDADQAIGLLADAGKQLPLSDKFEILVLTETQPRWLNFMNGTLDVVEVPKDNYDAAVDRATNDLKEEFKKKNVRLSQTPELDTTYISFNVEDPFIAKAGPKFRQALSMATDQQRTIELFFNGRGVLAQSPIPPGIAGYDSAFVNPYAKHDIEQAKKLLAEAGFPGGKGVPELAYEIGEGADSRQMAEKLQAEWAQIGVKIRVNINRFAELVEKLNNKKAQVWGIAWIGDYPDAENFLQLLYGPNKSPSPNAANYDNPEYNKLFAQMRGMEDSPERRKVIRQMQEIFVRDMPWIVGAHRITINLVQPWSRNFKAGYMGTSYAKFLGVDLAKKKEALDK
ncbi:MAG TPA: ABC transporter substrate-binding protein [Bdellovibrionota bacterium]|nr:ABC transporter substrate-binding protein [Bdellovibrionota bacterium]